MPVFLSTQGFQKYNPFPQPPPVGSQIERRSSEEARFPVNFRRAFPGKPSRSGDNHHHPEVDLFVLYAVVYPFARIHCRFTVFPSILSQFRRASPCLFSLLRCLLAAAGRPSPRPAQPQALQDGRTAPRMAARPVPCPVIFSRPGLCHTVARTATVLEPRKKKDPIANKYFLVSRISP